MPPAIRGRDDRARRHAGAASVGRKSSLLAAGALVVWGSGERHLLRHARVHQRALSAAGSAVPGGGIRDRNDHQGLADGREDDAGAGDVTSRRAKVAPAAFEHHPRWLEDAAVLSDAEPALAIPGAGEAADLIGPDRICAGAAGRADTWRPFQLA